MVRTVKDLFRKANGKAVLNYDQFHTALTDVQAVINSRPLVYVGEDDDESHPLTPFNLLHGHPSDASKDLRQTHLITYQPNRLQEWTEPGGSLSTTAPIDSSRSTSPN